MVLTDLRFPPFPSSCFRCLSAGITDVSHHTRLNCLTFNVFVTCISLCVFVYGGQKLDRRCKHQFFPSHQVGSRLGGKHTSWASLALSSWNIQRSLLLRSWRTLMYNFLVLFSISFISRLFYFHTSWLLNGLHKVKIFLLSKVWQNVSKALRVHWPVQKEALLTHFYLLLLLFLLWYWGPMEKSW